jgi:hypothetical protein
MASVVEQEHHHRLRVTAIVMVPVALLATSWRLAPQYNTATRGTQIPPSRAPSHKQKLEFSINNAETLLTFYIICNKAKRAHHNHDLTIRVKESWEHRPKGPWRHLRSSQCGRMAAAIPNESVEIGKISYRSNDQDIHHKAFLNLHIPRVEANCG